MTSASTSLLWVLALLACAGDRRPESRALALFERGREQLAAGDPTSAAESFRLAVVEDPQRPVLRSWQAYAVAAGGNPTAAIQLLEGEGLAALSPHDRYNLAAWHARLGDRESALALLEVALEDEPALRESVADDPDLESLRADGALAARLVDSELRVVMLGEEGAILAGEFYDLELTLQPASLAVSLEWEAPLPAGFTLSRVVDGRSGEPGEPGLRELHYRLRARQGGEGSLGPWVLHAGERSSPIQEQPWQALVPPGVDLGEPAPLPALDPVWWTPREALAGLEAGQAESRHGLLVVCFLPGDQLELGKDALAGKPLDIELRLNDQPSLLARAWRWAPGARSATVVITRKGARVTDAVVPRTDDS